MRTSRLLFFLSLAALAGCTRSVPTELPRASAASPEGAEAPPARVGRALEEEPPLPGENREGWEALDQGARPAGHHGHHGSSGGSADEETQPSQSLSGGHDHAE